MITIGDRVEVDVPEHYTHGCRGSVVRYVDGNWFLVLLEGEADARNYNRTHLKQVAGDANPAEFETATGALQ